MYFLAAIGLMLVWFASVAELQRLVDFVLDLLED